MSRLLAIVALLLAGITGAVAQPDTRGNPGVSAITDGTTTIFTPYKLTFSGGSVASDGAGGATVTGSGTGMPVTGGAFSGAVTFNGAGTGLTVSTSASINGNLTMGSGSSNVLINQAGTGPLFQIRMGSSATGMRFQTGAGATILALVPTSVQPAMPVVLSLATVGYSVVPQNSVPLYHSGTWTGTSASGVGVTSPLGWSFSETVALDSSLNNTGVVGGSMNVNTAAGFKGGSATGIFTGMQIGAPSGNAGSIEYIALQTRSAALANDGGTAGAGNGRSSVSGLVSGSLISVANAFYSITTSGEFATSINTGSTTDMKNGVYVMQYGTDAVAGTTDDIGIGMWNQFQQTTGGTSGGWRKGISFGSTTNNYPIAVHGTMITATAKSGGDSLLSDYGVDFSLVTFSQAFLKSAGFLVDGTGIVTGLAYKVGATAGVDCTVGTVNVTTAIVSKGIVTHC